MKKVTRMVATAVSMLLVAAGCSTTPTPSNLATAQILGTGAAATWLVAAKPTPAQEVQVVGVLNTIQVTATSLGTNTSYVAVLEPVIQAYVANNNGIAPQDKPVIMAGSLALLLGMDLMFQANPQWRTDTTGASAYINAFITGAKSALVLPATDPQNVSAANNYKATFAPKK